MLLDLVSMHALFCIHSTFYWYGRLCYCFYFLHLSVYVCMCVFLVDRRHAADI